MFASDTILFQCNKAPDPLPLKQLQALSVESGACLLRAHREPDTGECYVYFDLPARRALDAGQLSALEARVAGLLPGAAVKALGLKRVQYTDGAAIDKAIGVHFVVEIAFPRELDGEINRWYGFEHMPGFSSVSGCVRSTRYLNEAGRSFACYDLVSAEVRQGEEWMKWRDSEWTSRISPHYTDIKRGLFRDLMK